MFSKNLDKLDPLERKTLYRQLRDSLNNTKAYLRALNGELKLARNEVKQRN